MSEVLQYRRVDDLINSAQEIHRQAIDQRKSGDYEAAEANYRRAEATYNQLLSRLIGDPAISYLLGTLYMEKNWHGLAIQLLKTAVEGQPEFGEAWNNLGICFAREHDHEKADEFFAEAQKLLPGVSDIPANRSSLNINTGTPEKALDQAELCLRQDPDNELAKWHKALALLELGRLKEAWPWHEARLNGKSGFNIEVRNYGVPRWDGSKKAVVIHGEQGLGDEIMFASCIPETSRKAKSLVLECAPRLEGLFNRSFPGVSVVGTHKLDGSDLPFPVEAWCPLGSLPLLLKRNRPKDFPKGPFLKADPEKVKRLRRGKTRIGFAWQGGAARTRIDLRSVTLDALLPILKKDATFVPLQYTPHSESELREFNEKHGLNIEFYPEAVSPDMDDPAALVASCDLVVTVCQTAVHLAGGLGVECWILTPSRPSWRYGVRGKSLPWYGKNEMFRQVGDDWTKPLKEIEERLDAYLEKTNLDSVGPTRTEAGDSAPVLAAASN